MKLDIKALFGDKESLTADELTAALGDMNLVDLNEGGYVDKAKHERLVNAESKKVTELTAKVAELEAGKDDGSKDELTKTIEKLTADLNAVTEQQKAADSKATRLEREKAVGAKVRDPKLARLAYLDAEQKMAGDESLTFEEALEAVIESDPDYQRDENADEDTAVVVSTGKPVQGKPATDKFKAAIDSVFDEAAPEK